MKKNSLLLMIIGVLAVIAIGVSFAYFVSGVGFKGTGASNTAETAKLVKVEYDAGTSSLNVVGLYPGKTTSKSFKVSVTPGSTETEVTYAIKLNIISNGFTKCTDNNYNIQSNPCIKNAEELIYTLKDNNGNIIATKDITGARGEVILATITKDATKALDYNYNLEITLKNTGGAQNHNTNQNIKGEVKVVFASKAE